MKIEQLTKLNMPDSPGVYVFRDAKKRPLYIGRATSLRDRVRSYFRADVIEGRGPRIVDMVTKAVSVSFETQDSVLEAILLESELIKRYQPQYNVDERDDKSSQYVIITDEPWPRVFLARARDFDQEAKLGTLPYEVKRKFGPYPESGLIKEAMKILRKLFPFRDKKSLDPRHEAFYRVIGQSPEGQDEPARQAYLRTIDYLILFFQGKKARLKLDIKRSMKLAVTELRFEEAGSLKRLLYALEHVNDMALIKRDASAAFSNKQNFRIEAYDAAHLGGEENVGVMVVSTNGQLDKNEYRKFKISKNKSDDIAALGEMLTRRLNHSEWQFPNLIVVDGNKVQIQKAEAILSTRRINIPVVAVTKDEHHKADRLVGNPDIIKKYHTEIVAINAEAHRFAIKYHRERLLKSRRG